MKGPFVSIEKVFSPATRFAENIDDAPLETAEARYESATPDYAAIPHPDAGELEIAKSAVKGHGEQTILPDECQYGDNILCYVEA